MEFGQSTDDLINRTAAYEKIFAAIHSTFDQNHGIDIRHFRMDFGDQPESFTLFSSVPHPVCIIGFLYSVDPAITKCTFAVKKQK